jgi:hypothetical protein
MSRTQIKNKGTSPGGPNKGKILSTQKRVVDIILDDKHPKYNGPGSLGLIFFSDVASGETTLDPHTLPTALPLNRTFYQCPVIGEIVDITQYVTDDYYEETGGNPFSTNNFYTLPINVHNNNTHNSLPPSSFKKNNSTQEYTTKPSNTGTYDEEEFKLGQYYVDKPQQQPLTTTEGGTFLEGGSGQRIHYTTTAPEGINNISNNVTDDPNDDNPTVGDPAILISVGKNAGENINNDDGSIYVLTNQNTNIDPASKNTDSLKSEYTPVQDDPLKKLELVEIELEEEEIIEEEEDLFVTGSNPVVEETVEEEKIEKDNEFSDPVFDALDEAVEEGILSEYEENPATGTTDLSEEERQEVDNSPTQELGGEEYIEVGSGNTLIINNSKEYQDWKSKGKGKQDYPMIVKPKRSGGKEVLVNPKSVSDLIKQLKADNVNSTGISRIKNLVIHVSATPFQTQHDLANLFMNAKSNGQGWTRHGYNISIDDLGGCNYNVNLKDPGNSYGCGGNIFENKSSEGSGIVTNRNSINISWIGDGSSVLNRPELAEGGTTKPNITSAQAYALEQMVLYFVEAFPNIKVFGHNQITLSGGYGKSCPTFDPVKYLTNIGVPDKNIYKKHIYDHSLQHLIDTSNAKCKAFQIKKYGEPFDVTNKDLFKNFKGYYNGTKYSNTADYVYRLAFPSERGINT